METETTNAAPDAASALRHAYQRHIVTKGRRPKSIAKFCMKQDLSEKDFYVAYASFEQLEEDTWVQLLHQTLNTLAQDETYKTYSVREKLLSFYFTFFQEAQAQRSYFKWTSGDLRDPKLLKNKKFKEHLMSYFQDLTEEGVDSNEIQARWQLERQYPHAAWVQFLFLLNFWLQDQSAGFTDTDMAIEKSVRWVFDLTGPSGIDSGIDLVKFLFRQIKMA
jgi:hypothetical protein